ncbi:MAG: hypothetical protein IJ805_00515, partial [Lachnospiraceae bacterium]|nr:hypothetical protein [Lachnospiraceae bacterium]
MKKERKRLNRRVLAFVLVLAMVFSQYTGVFAGEISGNVTVSAPAQEAATAPVTDGTAAAGDVTAANDGTQTGTEEGTGTDDGTLAADDTKTDEQDVQPGNDQGSPVPETPAGNENTDPEQTEKEEASENTAGTASDDKAEKSASENGPVVEEQTGEELKTVAAISLNASNISISINDPVREDSDKSIKGFTSENTVSYVSIEKYVGEALKVDFDVLSANQGDTYTTLKEGEDYDVTYRFAAWNDNDANLAVKDPSFKTDVEGFVSVNIAGKGKYQNNIAINYWVSSKTISFVETDISINGIYKNGVNIKNNLSQNVVYAVVMSGNEADIKKLKECYQMGKAIAANGSVDLYEYMDKDGESHAMTPSTNYVVAVSTDFVFTTSDNGVLMKKFKTLSDNSPSPA